jgi:hypothetical protein
VPRRCGAGLPSSVRHASAVGNRRRKRGNWRTGFDTRANRVHGEEIVTTSALISIPSSLMRLAGASALILLVVIAILPH